MTKLTDVIEVLFT